MLAVINSLFVCWIKEEQEKIAKFCKSLARVPGRIIGPIEEQQSHTTTWPGTCVHLSIYCQDQTKKKLRGTNQKEGCDFRRTFACRSLCSSVFHFWDDSNFGLPCLLDGLQSHMSLPVFPQTVPRLFNCSTTNMAPLFSSSLYAVEILSHTA